MEKEVQAQRHEGDVVGCIRYPACQLQSDEQQRGLALHAAKEKPDGRRSVYTEAGHCHSQDLLLLTHNVYPHYFYRRKMRDTRTNHADDLKATECNLGFLNTPAESQAELHATLH
ncbi:hypothetical protein AMECASPLE_007862 [Ameca splendens]|uniref:Uncharacterized protein n=1 Tax=Ameca splendens TaxID=208324 RepID=A0ABV1A7G4_9TELE